MKEFMEKLIERLGDEYLPCEKCEWNNAILRAVEIVYQTEEEYKSNLSGNSIGWIPVEERLPETDDYILLSFDNYVIPAIGRYAEDAEGGAFYLICLEERSCVSFGLFVNAWQPLPEKYRPERPKKKEVPTDYYMERFNRVM